MAAGTLSVTNNSKNVTGAGTTFTTQLAAGAFIVLTVGQVAYTVAVASVTNNGALVLELPFDGPTASGLAWDPIPRSAMALATMGVTVQAQKALRNMIAEAGNWSQIFSGQTTVTVTTPNGQQFTGPSWGYMADNMLLKNNNLSDLANKETARTNLELGASNNVKFGNVNANGVNMSSNGGGTSPVVVAQVFSGNGLTLLGQAEFRANSNGNLELINRTAGTAQAFVMQPDGSVSFTRFSGRFRCDGMGLGAGRDIAASTPIGVVQNVMADGGTQAYRGTTASSDMVVGGVNFQYAPAMSFLAGDVVGGLWVDYRTGRAMTTSGTASGISSGTMQYNVLWGTANTTVDGNGFIKRASPIVKIFGDGSGETNNESEGAAVERVGVGEYLITGVTGLNSDAAWGGIAGGIEVPRDMNGQPRLWVDYKVKPDGDLVVKTYHREHSNAPEFARNKIEGINDGDPIDIPSDVFVSVRVEMPANSIFNEQIAAMDAEQAAGLK